jgi:UDP-N-acetylmuramate dehydrogenase
MIALLGDLKQAQSLARFTSWHVGGEAERYYKPHDLNDLANYLQNYHDGSAITWLGLGSNVLIRDGGITGTVIHTLNRLKELRMQDDLAYAQAGVPCAKFAKWCMRQGLAGAEFFAGIPGTMGGALRMNAGAYGGDTWSVLQKVQLLHQDGSLTWHDPAEFTVGYRSVTGMDDAMFAGACFKLSSSTSDVIADYTKNMLQKRNAAQPIGTFNCGSVFRNPEGDYAARLIEQCGLKGYCKEGACVSNKHANFIVNDGTANAYAIESLIKHVQTIVLEQAGVALIRECHLLGNFLPEQEPILW